MNWPTAIVISAALLGSAVLAASADTAGEATAPRIRDAIADAGRQQGHPVGTYALSWHASDGAVRLCWADLTGQSFGALQCSDWAR